MSVGQRQVGFVLPLLLVAVAGAGPPGIPPVVPGFPNVAQVPGELLSGLNAPQQGRTSIIAYHNGILYTVPEIPASQPGSDFQVRSWDISDPTDPQELEQLGITRQPVSGHGYVKIGDYLALGDNFSGDWSFRYQSAGVNERTTLPGLIGPGDRGMLFQPWYVGQTFWSYDEVAGDALIGRYLLPDGPLAIFAEFDHLQMTGVIGHPFLLGNILIFASDQSRTGVATYDVSDPTNPILLDVLTNGGPGGYWPELWGGGDRLLIVFPYRVGGNGMRVVDATDPTNLSFITDRPLPGDQAMYAQFQDEYAFIGSHKVDMRTFESVLDVNGASAVRTSDGGIGVDTSQFALPLGNLLVTGGVDANQGMAIWAHQAAADTRGPEVGFHVPRPGQTNYPTGLPISLLIHETLESYTLINGETFIVRPLAGAAINGRLVLAFDDILTFTPDQDLDPDTTYEVVLPAGGIKDAAGNGMVGYSFSFSTGGAIGGNSAPSQVQLDADQYPLAPGQEVLLTASAIDADGDALQYRFDFGDGSPKTVYSTDFTAAHSFAAAGHYLAVVQARDPAGAVASATLTLTVVDDPAPQFGTASSPIVCDAAGRRVWTVNPDNDSLTAIDADTLTLIGEYSVCQDPRSVALAADGNLWVACHDQDAVAVVAADGQLSELIPAGYGSAPLSLTVNATGSSAYVSLSGAGRLQQFDTATRQTVGLLDLGPGPAAIAVAPDDSRLVVTRFVSPRNHAEVWEADAALSAASTHRIAKFGGDGNRDTTASGRGVANYLAGALFSADGSQVWIASKKDNVERGLVFGPDLDQDNTVRTVISRLDLDLGQLSNAIDIDNSDSARAFAYAPLGDYLFVALQGNNQVAVFDALNLDAVAGLGGLVTRIGTGLAPQGLCMDAPSERLFVKNFMGRSVTAVNLAELLARGDKTLPATTIVTVAAEALGPQVLQGKRIFYNAADSRMSAEGYLSCASCHVDGGHDGRIWDFSGRGEGFRNTTSLRGRAGTGHGNVHWSGNFDEIQDFELDIRGAFGGSGFMDEAAFASSEPPLGPPKAGLSVELDALAAYVSSLDAATIPASPFRNADGSLTPSAQNGRTVFENLGCADCHGGPQLTDSTLGSANLHDVGTLRTTSGMRLGGPLPGIDAPTLMGLWNTAPYLHDGSAETVAEVFGLAGGVVLEAESGVPGSGASLTTEFVDLNNDDTVHNRGLANLDQSGATLTFNNVDGGSGGSGAVELRYSLSYHPDTVELEVNGVAAQQQALPTGNQPAFRYTIWERLRFEDVSFTAGPTNTVVIRVPDPFPNLGVDTVTVSTSEDLTRALPHRAALALDPSDRDDLIAFLLQIDRPIAGLPVPGLVFADGFEG